jgi:hypothetical protein
MGKRSRHLAEVRGKMLLRNYARLVAGVSFLASVAGVFGWLALGKGSALLYLFTAGVFAYAGTRRGDTGFTRTVVGSFGKFYLASGLVLAVLFVALKFPFEGGAYAEVFGLAIVGGMSAVCARVLPYEDDLPQGGQEGAPRKD